MEVRPCPSATWEPGLPTSRWQAADLAFVEAEAIGKAAQEGRGVWKGPLLEEHGDGGEGSSSSSEKGWVLESGAGFQLGLAAGPSGQVGAFPEQAEHWAWLRGACASRASEGKACRVLNLFAHTGGRCVTTPAFVKHLKI